MNKMTFNDSMMARILEIPKEAWTDFDLYHFVLAMPAILFVVVLGVVFALAFDLFIAMNSLGER